jgi:ABC-type nitrate/sulfonate/bicarbonate transport system substrate-binding protein
MPDPTFARTWNRRRLLSTGATGLGVLLGGRLLIACGGDDDDAGSATTAGAPSGASTASMAPGTTTGGTSAGSVPATAEVSVGMGWIKNVEYAGSWLALENGFYAEVGIEPDYQQGGPNAPASPVAVASGDAQIGVAAGMLALLDAINEGNDFVVFGTQYQVSPGAVLSLASKPVKTPEDLIGIRFLGQEGVDVTIDAVLDVAGLPHDYEFIVAGFTPDPLIEGQGDAYSCFLVNQPITLEQQGLKEGTDFVVTPWADLGFPSYANLFFAERSYVEANRDAVVRYMRATIMGWEQNKVDPAIGAQLAVETYGADLGLDITQQTRQNELQIPLMESELTTATGLFRIDPEQWDGPMTAAYLASGRASMPAVGDVVDLTILDDVFEGKTTLLG